MSLFHFRVRGGRSGNRIPIPTPLVAILGVVVFYFGGFQLYDSYLLSNRGVVTTGEVMSKNYTTRKGHRRATSLTIRFQTLSGGHVEFRGTPMNGMSSHTRGEAVSVIYDPQHPSRANINDPLCLWLPPALFTGMGIAVLGMCVVKSGLRS